MKKNGGWGFFPPLKSTAEMCADSLVLPEIDKSECCANFHRKSSPVQRRSATSHAGLQTDMHLTFLAPKQTFSSISVSKCPISSDQHIRKGRGRKTNVSCILTSINRTMHIENFTTRRADICFTLLVFTRKPTMHCSTSLVQTNKWFPLCWKISEPGNVCFGDDGSDSKHGA